MSELDDRTEGQKKAARARVAPALELLLVATQLKNNVTALALKMAEEDFDAKEVLDALDDALVELHIGLDDTTARIKRRLALSDMSMRGITHFDMRAWEAKEKKRQAARRRAIMLDKIDGKGKA